MIFKRAMLKLLLSTIASVGVSLSLHASDNNFIIGNYAGNGSSQSTENQVNVGIDFANHDGLVILRAPVESGVHWFDSIQGAGAYLDSTANHAKQTNTGFSAFTNTGFTVTGQSTSVNSSGGLYQYLAFAEQAGFLDIVTYTGNHAAQRAIPHDLGTDVGMIIIKNLSDAQNGLVWHKSLSSGSDMKNLWLFGQGDSNPADQYAYALGNTQPNHSHFYVGASGSTNGTGKQYIAYVFADNPEAGVTVGKYTGNSTDGALVTFPWQPDAIFLKPLSTSLAKNWTLWSPHLGHDHYGILDRVRSGYDTSLGAYMTLNRAGELVKTTRVPGHDISFNEPNKDYLYIAFKNMGAASNSPIKVQDDFAALHASSQQVVDVLVNDHIPTSITPRIHIDSNSNPAFSASIVDGKLRVTAAESGQTSITYHLEDASNSGISSATATLTVSLQTPNQIHSSLVAEYLFDSPEDLGKDTSGNEHHGTVLGNNLSSITGIQSGSGVHFGGNSFIEIPSDPELSIHPQNGMTVTYWIKNNTHSSFSPILLKGKANQYEWGISESANTLFAFIFGQWGAGLDGAKANIGSSGWHHVAINFDGLSDGSHSSAGRVSAYVDGVLITTASGVNATTSYAVSNAPLHIGWWTNNSGTFYADDALDNIRIFKRKLTAEEIVRDFNNTLFTEPSHAFAAMDDTYALNGLGTHELSVMSNDVLGDTTELSVELLAMASSGFSATVENNIIHYNALAAGEFSLSYVLKDAQGNTSNSATINLVVTHDETPVQALTTPDNFTVAKGFSTFLDLLKNDNVSHLRVNINVPSTSALGGTISLKNGVVFYAGNTVGHDSFVYSLSDDAGNSLGSAIAYVSVVENGQDIPLAQQITHSVTENDSGMALTLSFAHRNMQSCRISKENHPELSDDILLFDNSANPASTNTFSQTLALPLLASDALTITCASADGNTSDIVLALDSQASSNEITRITALNVSPQHAKVGESQTITIDVQHASKCWLPASMNDGETDLILHESAIPTSAQISQTIAATAPAGAVGLTVYCTDNTTQFHQKTTYYTRSSFKVMKPEVLVGEPNALVWDLPNVNYCQANPDSNQGQMDITSVEAIEKYIVKWICVRRDGSDTQYSTEYRVNKLSKPTGVVIEGGQ